MDAPLGWTVFRGDTRLTAGDPQTVVTALKPFAERGDLAGVLVFDDTTGRVIDLDLTGPLTDCLARLPQPAATVEAPTVDRRPGRPKLGVVAREVTLLPRHWDWLGQQPGGASVALRKLVEAARTANAPADRKRGAQAAADQFMRTLAGDQPGYENAARSLYAGDQTGFEAHTRDWPAEVRDHARALASPALQ